MPIRVVCPGCTRQFVFPDASYGQRTNCQACGTPLTISPAPLPAAPGGASAWGSAAAPPAPQPGYPSAGVGPTQHYPPAGVGPTQHYPPPGVPMPGPPRSTTPPTGLPMPGLPMPGAAHAGLPQYGGPQHGTPQYGIPQPGAPQYGVPQPGMSGGAMPQAGLPAGMPRLPSGPTVAGGVTLPEIGRPEMGTGLPSLPTASIGRGAARDPRFGPSAAGPWYANPWIWTGGGLGAVLVLGIFFTALGGTGGPSRPAEAVANSEEAASPTPEEPRRPGFSRFVPGKPLRRGGTAATATAPAPAIPADASAVSAASAAPNAGADVPASSTAEVSVTVRFDKPRQAPARSAAAIPPITERIPADVAELLTPDRGTPPPGAEKHWELAPDPDPNFAPATATTANVPLFEVDSRALTYATPKPQPFVVADHRATVFGGPLRLYSLPPGRKPTEITTDTRSLASVLCVSADGKLVAGPVMDGPSEEMGVGRGRLPASPRLGIFDKEVPGRIAVVDGRSSKVRWNLVDPLGRPALAPSFFAGPELLLIRTSEGFVVWELPATGPAPTEPKALIPWTGGPAVTLTPGRKFLVGAEAHPDGLSVRIFSVEEGKEVAHHIYAELQAPEAEKEELRRPGANGFGTIPSIAVPAISPDGTEIALAVSEAKKPVVAAIVDFDSGILRRRHVVAGISPREAWMEGADYLDWMPGGYGLLLGRFVIERGSGKVILSGPPPGGFDRFRPRTLPIGQVLQVVDGRLAILPIPTKQLLSAVRTVRAGKELVDAGLPPLRDVDWTGAIEAGSGSGSDRRLEPDPLPLQFERGARRIPIGDGRPSSLQFVPVRKGLLIAGYSAARPEEDSDPTASARTRGKIRVRELDGTGSADATNLPTGTVPEAVSPTAKRLATLTRAGDRVDVWELADLKHVAGARPFADEPTTADEFKELGPFEKRRSARRIAWCGFADDEHLWTLTEAGKMVCWRLPEFKAIAVAEDVARETILFSPGNRVLAVTRKDRQQFWEAKSGELLAEFPSPGRSDSGAAAFSSDGKRFALIRNSEIVRLDLETRRRTLPGRLPGMATQVLWLNEHQVLAGDWIYDFRAGFVLWSYPNAWKDGLRPEGFPDGHLWRAVEGGGEPRLVALPLPDAAALRKFAELGPELIAPLLGPGRKVRFDASGLDLPNLPAIRERFDREARANGFVVADDAVLTFRAELKQIGETKFEFVDANRPPTMRATAKGFVRDDVIHVSVPHLEVRAQLLDADRQVVWQTSGRTAVPLIRPGDRYDSSIQSSILDVPKNSAAEFLMRVRLPKEILQSPRQPDGRYGFGSSKIEYDGTIAPSEESPDEAASN